MLLDRDVSDGELSESDFDSIMDRLADLSATALLSTAHCLKCGQGMFYCTAGAYFDNITSI